MYFLDCPFSEKDEAKAVGAKFDRNSKKWFVPPDLYPSISTFNRWRPKGRIYLNVKFEDKDEAKSKGAKWDSTIKKWYTSKPSPALEQWIDPIGSPACEKKSSSAVKPDNSTSSLSSLSGAARRGNAQQAARLQISDAMTVPQLQQECRHRGIKGLSGKSKSWLLEQLIVGTTWLSHPLSAHTSDTKPAPSKKRKEPATSSSPSIGKPKPTKKATTSTSKKQQETPARKETPTTKKPPKKDTPTTKKKATPAPKKLSARAECKSMNWSSAPRVTTKLTIAQLSHELLKRDPSVKGLSSKSKSWFLQNLGENSVWTTSPNIDASKIASASVICSSLTKSQLLHELMARKPDIKGLSSKTKEELLGMVAIGSIWTTRSNPTKSTAAKPPPAKKARKEPISKKTNQPEKPLASSVAKSVSSTKKAATPASAVVLAIPKKLAKDAPGVPPMTTSASVVSVAPEQVKAKGKTPVAVSSSSEIPSHVSMVTSAPEVSKASVQKKKRTKAVPVPPTTKAVARASPPKRMTAAPEQVKTKGKTPVAVRSSSETPSHVSTVTSAAEVSKASVQEKKRAKAVPVPTTTKSVARASPPKRMKNEEKTPDTVASSSKTIAQMPTVESSGSNDLSAISKALISKPNAVPDSVASSVPVTSQRPAKAVTKKKAPVPQTNEDKLVVTNNLTMTQLRAELEYRQPRIRGLSNKPKRWLIAELGEGTPILGVKADAEARSLHVHNIAFYPHPLADSKLLRGPRSLGPYDGRKRIDTAVCNLRRPLVCTKKPYRSSEPHDYDICKACFDIESLPEPERKQKLAEIDKRLLETQREKQRQWRQEQQELRLRWRREQEARELAKKQYMERFTAKIKKPTTDERRKLKFTVCIHETHRKCHFPESPRFDSSFDSLEDANLRVEYLFYYKDQEEDIHTTEDKMRKNQFRYLLTEDDYGNSHSVFSLPSEAFDALSSLNDFKMKRRTTWSEQQELQEDMEQRKFPTRIRSPPQASLSRTSKLRYAIWTSDGYDNDGWHSYQGPPEKSFDSSFASVEEANQRAEYVFYFKNPWGLGLDEMGYAETDAMTTTGFRYLESCPEDSSRWTVSVIPSTAFPFLDLF